MKVPDYTVVLGVCPIEHEGLAKNSKRVPFFEDRSAIVNEVGLPGTPDGRFQIVLLLRRPSAS